METTRSKNPFKDLYGAVFELDRDDEVEKIKRWANKRFDEMGLK